MKRSNRRVFNTAHELFDELRKQYPGMRKALTATWAVDIKREVAADLKRVIAELEVAIKDAKQRKKETEANSWRQAQVFLQSIEAEIRMWLCISEGNASGAWDHFVTAEQCGEQVAGWLQDFEPAQAHVKHLAEVERVVFPKLMFFSSAFIAAEDDQHCTLCDSVYGTCGHIAGELYEGDVAGRRIAPTAVREISLVENPSSKRCRVLSVGGMDPLTGEPCQKAVTEEAS